MSGVATMARKAERASMAAKMLRAVRKAEADGTEALHSRVRRGEVEHPGSLDPGTGQTILKFHDGPIARLIKDKKIGPEELRAAEDIRIAVAAQTSALWIKPLSMERVDKAATGNEPARILDAVARYKVFANVWTIRAKRGDPSLAALTMAVVDDWPFWLIEQDLRLRHGMAPKAVAAALRDYAARAGWATGAASRNWLVSEGAIFRLRKI